MIFIKERIGRLIKDVEALVYPYEVKIDSYKIKKTCERFCDISQIEHRTGKSFTKKKSGAGTRNIFGLKPLLQYRMNGTAGVLPMR